ncbi:hypothetical protein ACFZAU_31290 [Streptomyces sp. NPDC008238]
MQPGHDPLRHFADLLLHARRRRPQQLPHRLVPPLRAHHVVVPGPGAATIALVPPAARRGRGLRGDPARPVAVPAGAPAVATAEAGVRAGGG